MIEDETSKNILDPKKIVSMILYTFILSFGRILLIGAFLNIYLTELKLDPDVSDFVTGPLALFGLWFLLYRPRLVISGVRNK